MRLFKRLSSFFVMTLIFILLLSPFLLGFFLKLLATGFYSGLEQAENFLITSTKQTRRGQDNELREN